METIKFKEFFSRKPTTINFSIIFLIIALYLFLFLIPGTKTLFGRLSECSRLQAKIVATEKDWANLESFKAKISRLNERIDYYEKRLPGGKQVPAILEYLSNAAKELNVRITEISPVEQGRDKVAAPSLYYKVPVLLKAECGYHQLGRFLNKLESADRFMKISDIKIAANRRKTNIHSVQLTIVTYVMSQR